MAADLETPVSAYLKLARGRYGYLLESVEGGERLARYSFVGTDPYLVLRVRDGVASTSLAERRRALAASSASPCADPLEAVRAELERRPIAPAGAGAAAFPRRRGRLSGLRGRGPLRAERFPSQRADPLGLPESVFMFSDTLLIFDHARHTARLLTYADIAATGGDETRARLRRRHGWTRWSGGCGGRRRARRPRPAGRARQPASVPAARLESRAAYERGGARASRSTSARATASRWCRRGASRGPLRAHPSTVYRALRSINPSPYMFYLALDDLAVAGASPELLVRVEDGEVAVHPIAGTRRRDADPARDAALEAELRADEKERAEHVMLVDLGRNDVGRVSEPGSVRVTQFMDVERYSHVMHLVSHVTGRLRAGLTPYDALRAGFPAGTVSGAPKVRAMQIIAELEGQRRGVYAGAVGYIGFDGALDTCIAIRTLVLKDGVAYAQAGGGIVADSQPDGGVQETENKLGRASLRRAGARRKAR